MDCPNVEKLDHATYITTSGTYVQEILDSEPINLNRTYWSIYAKCNIISVGVKYRWLSEQQIEISFNIFFSLGISFVSLVFTTCMWAPVHISLIIGRQPKQTVQTDKWPDLTLDALGLKSIIELIKDIDMQYSNESISISFTEVKCA